MYILQNSDFFVNHTMYVFEYKNLLLWLNNYKSKEILDDFESSSLYGISVYEVTNILGIRRTYDSYYGTIPNIELIPLSGTITIHQLSNKEKYNIFIEAVELRNEHKNDEKFNYKRQINTLGHEVKSILPNRIKHRVPHYANSSFNKYKYMRTTSHTTSPYKHSNTNRIQSNSRVLSAMKYHEALNIYLNIVDSNGDEIIYKNLPFTHHNRRLDENSYEWDDWGGMLSRHSTGWKSDKKQEHQYSGKINRNKVLYLGNYSDYLSEYNADCNCNYAGNVSGNYSENIGVNMENTVIFSDKKYRKMSKKHWKRLYKIPA